MKRILLASVVVVIAACSAPSLESHLAADSAEHNANCFTVLNPAGFVENGAFQEVHFYNGNCTGTTKALNKLAMKKDVLVIRGNDRVKSSLFLEGNVVSVKVDGESIAIGEMIEAGAHDDFKLADKVGFDLMVYDDSGDARAWKFGDKATADKEEIAIFL